MAAPDCEVNVQQFNKRFLFGKAAPACVTCRCQHQSPTRSHPHHSYLAAVLGGNTIPSSYGILPVLCSQASRGSRTAIKKGCIFLAHHRPPRVFLRKVMGRPLQSERRRNTRDDER